MPYSISNPPDFLKSLPSEAISIFVRVFNDIHRKTNDEERARRAAWAAIKAAKYHKDGDEWKKKK